MSTQVAYPRTVPSGPSGKSVAGILAAAVAVVGIGYGIASLDGSEPAASVSGVSEAQIAEGKRLLELNSGYSHSPSAGSDTMLFRHAAELAAQQAAFRARTEQMTAINEIPWGEPSMISVNQLVAEAAQEFAAEQAAAQARTQRMLELNEFGFEPAVPSVDQIIAEALEESALAQSQATLIRETKGVGLGSGPTVGSSQDPRAEFLRAAGEQWRAQQDELDGSGPKSPLLYE